MRQSAILFLSAFLLLSLSCNRDNVNWDGEYFSTLDNGFVESEFSAIQQMMEVEARAEPSIYGKTTGTTGLFCPDATVTVTANGPSSAILRIDFSSGTNCLDGRLRSGALVATFNGLWKDQGSTVVIRPDNYTVSSYAFSFTQTVSVNAKDADNRSNWTTTVDNAQLFHPQNGQITWNSERTTVWVAGENTPTNFTDDAFEVTGSASGITRLNRDFTADIVTPLRIVTDCSYIVSGTVTINPRDLNTRTVDYGPGSCDNRVMLTVGSFQQEFFLP
jgi:hypothetical protein